MEASGTEPPALVPPPGRLADSAAAFYPIALFDI